MVVQARDAEFGIESRAPCLPLIAVHGEKTGSSYNGFHRFAAHGRLKKVVLLRHEHPRI
jgi:hypothetical protein